MLITERAIINPPRTTRVRNTPQTVALPEPVVQPVHQPVAQPVRQPVAQPDALVSSQPQIKRGALSQTIQRLGDRQSWLLLVLVLIPVFGAISNLLTYGLAR